MIYDPFPYNRCAVCGEYKPFTTVYFASNKGRITQRRCKRCNVQKAVAHNKAHPEQTYARHRRYYEKHREVCIARAVQWERDHREYRNAYHRQYTANNPQRKKMTQQRYYQRNQANRIQAGKRWRQANRLKTRTYTTNRRARKRQLPDSLTATDWQRCLEYWNNRCAVCGRPPGLWHTLAQDHWIPLSDPRLDNPGTVAWNIAPLCDAQAGGESCCNESKGSSDPIEWLNLHYSKRKAARIQARIEQYFQTIRSQHD